MSRGRCPVCRRIVRLRADGSVGRHHDLAGPPVSPDDDNTCAGTGYTVVPLNEPQRMSSPLESVHAGRGGLVRCLGDVHVVLDSENLLCGKATFDAGESENDPDAVWRSAAGLRTPTCAECVTIIKLCAPFARRVRA